MFSQIALSALNLLHEVSKKIPNFDERVRSSFHKSLTSFENEFVKPEHLIDDQRLDELRMELERRFETFKKELSK